TEARVVPVVEHHAHLLAALGDGALERAPDGPLQEPSLEDTVDLVPGVELGKRHLEGSEPTVVGFLACRVLALLVPGDRGLGQGRGTAGADNIQATNLHA